AGAEIQGRDESPSARAEGGDVRRLAGTPGVTEPTPAWSPDGQSIAYCSDETGEYALHVKAQTGECLARKIALAGKSAFYFAPHWSPDSKQIAFNDNQLNLWRAEIASGQVTKVDTDYFYPYGDMERDIAW